MQFKYKIVYKPEDSVIPEIEVNQFIHLDDAVDELLSLKDNCSFGFLSLKEVS